MSSRFGKALAVVAIVAATVAMGYTAWQTRNLRDAFDRMAAGDEKNLTEMMIALAQTEGHLARVRETMELLGSVVTSESDENARAGALEGKLRSTLTAAQREVLQQELTKWARQLQDRREKGWAALRKSLKQELSRNEANARKRDRRWTELTAALGKNQKNLTGQLQALGDGLSKPSGATEEQGAALAALEKRLAVVLKEDEGFRRALSQRVERDDKRWDELFLTLQENKEATRQRYAEVAARLEQWRKESEEPSGTADTGQPGQGSPGTQSGTTEERERLAEFCNEVPQSALCRDL